MANPTKAYNLALTNRIKAHYTQNHRNGAEDDATIAANRL